MAVLSLTIHGYKIANTILTIWVKISYFRSISDFYELILITFKITYPKLKSRIIDYKIYKNYEHLTMEILRIT